LIVAAELTQDGNDLRQLEPMSRAAKEELGVEHLKVLGDTGYHNLLQIHECEEQGIEVHSPVRAPRATEKDFYPVSAFQHDAEQDCYRCPNGQRLTRHTDDKQGEVIYRIYYNSAACRACSLRRKCTKAKYRKLHIHQYAEVGERVAARLREQPEIYARRKGLVEHVFGTIKWNWHQGALMTRGLASTRGEWMLSCLAYNLRRALNVAGVEALLEVLGGRRPVTEG
jgi:transposase